MKNNLVSIYVAHDILELNGVKDVLEKNGIAVVIRAYEDSAFKEIFKPQYGAGELLVASDRETEAKKIINDYLQAEKQLMLPEDEKPKNCFDDIKKKGRQSAVIVPVVVSIIFMALGILFVVYGNMAGRVCGGICLSFSLAAIWISHLNAMDNRN
ncbi:MAG TPA: hypothetical protein PL155_04630 [Candidatus Omnitrophota bacterium]|nr:hypothetical protein [Candidatus Omnitrophota bacterium]HPD84237.1 hypothetical protein [Candidatus Omnitrophota bacterium]HRZ03093.1 hypothetical protein [Candidatus Omnitrophota bacterium]